MLMNVILKGFQGQRDNGVVPAQSQKTWATWEEEEIQQTR